MFDWEPVAVLTGYSCFSVGRVSTERRVQVETLFRNVSTEQTARWISVDIAVSIRRRLCVCGLENLSQSSASMSPLEQLVAGRFPE